MIKMQRIWLLLFLCFIAKESFGTVYNKTLQVGSTYTISSAWGEPEYGYITGNAIAVEFVSGGSVRIKAIAPGYATFQNKYKYQDTYVIHVVDVIDIKIPDNLTLSKGDIYTYSPIITDAEANTTLTWTSSNTSVATVNSNGVVSTVGTGQTVVTCKASNGISALSVITVNPVLISSVSLNEHEYQMNVGENVQPTATLLPANASSTNVKWMTTNENIAQVDDSGTVTAIAPGYCSIFCIADDGSRKYDKCLVHVLGNAALRADVNGDGQVSVTDAFTVIDVILNNP